MTVHSSPSFGRLVLAIVIGVLIANGITWGLAELRFRWELREAEQQMATSIATSRAATQVELQRQNEERFKRDEERRAAQERQLGPIMRRADASVPVGQTACLGGWQVRRESNGWQEFFDGAGTRLKCRIRN